MSVDGTSNTTGANFGAVGNLDAETPFLGVEELMIMLSTRMGGIDTEIKGMMKNQEQRIAQRKALKEFETLLGGDKLTPEEYEKIRPKLEEAINSLPEGDPARGVMEKTLAALDTATNTSPEARAEHQGSGHTSVPTYQWGASWGPPPPSQADAKAPKAVPKEAMDTHRQTLKAEHENIGDNAEMEMLELQSNMTRRTTLVQLTTNIVQKLESAPDLIAKNI